jgi:DNA-directed RNA polymerase specialized sigma24 family protein
VSNAPSTVTRTEGLLAILVMQSLKDASQIDKIVMLSRAGFSNVEIADLLGTNAGTVASSLYTAKQAKKKKSPAKKSPAKAPAKKATS